MPGSRVLEGLLTVALTLTLAALSWRFIERPILTLKHRFDYRPGPDETGHRVGSSFALSLARE
jgi:peptidoglycan/LPS O-acetylase OafA/YrhL